LRHSIPVSSLSCSRLQDIARGFLEPRDTRQWPKKSCNSSQLSVLLACKSVGGGRLELPTNGLKVEFSPIEGAMRQT